MPLGAFPSHKPRAYIIAGLLGSLTFLLSVRDAFPYFNLGMFWRSTSTVGIADATGNEGSTLVFTVSLNRASPVPCKVSWATSDGTALAGTNYTAVTGGTITIPAGTLSTSVSVSTLNDTLDQATTAFTVSLSSPKACAIGRATATGTITDAKLYFDFLVNSLPAGLAFSRGSAANYVNSTGIITSAATDSPRFDYDPMTRQIRGLLLEAQSTNNMLYSEQLDSSGFWTPAAVTVSANSALTTAPDGSNNAELVKETATSAFHYLLSYPGGYSANSEISLSVFAKAVGSEPNIQLMVQDATAFTDNIRMTYNFSTGTVSGASNQGTGSGARGTMIPYPNGWYRLTLSGIPTTSYGNLGVQIMFNGGGSYAGNTSNGAYLWGAQLEYSSIPSSYFAAGATATTRSRDLLTVSNFSSWYNAAAWTAVGYFTRPIYEPTYYITFDILFEFNLAANWFNFQMLNYPGSNSGSSFLATEVYSSGVGQIQLYPGFTPAPNQIYESAMVKNGSVFEGYLNGSSSGTQTAGTVPAVDRLMLGGEDAGSDSILNGHLRKFTYRARAATATQLAAYTQQFAVSTLSPTVASTGGGGTLTVLGANFLAGATVTVGGSSCSSVTIVNSGTLTCTIPGGTAGVKTVVVTSGGSTQTLTGAFTYQ